METKGRHMASDDTGLFITPEYTDELGDTHDLSAAKNMTDEDEPAYPETPKYLMPDKVYDVIKWIVTVLMPALALLYVGLAFVWGFPYAEKVFRTFALVYSFLCALMGISSKQFAFPTFPSE